MTHSRLRSVGHAAVFIRCFIEAMDVKISDKHWDSNSRTRTLRNTLVDRTTNKFGSFEEGSSYTEPLAFLFREFSVPFSVRLMCLELRFLWRW